MKTAAGAIFTPGGFFDSKGNKIGDQIRHQVHLLDPARRARVVDLRRGPPAARPDRSLDRRGRGRRRRPGAGKRIKIVGQGRVRTFRLVGLTRLGSVSFGGTSIAQVTLPMAQRLTHKVGRFDQISVAAGDGSLGDGAETADRARDAARRQGRDGKENADRSCEEIRESLSFLRIFLLVFAFIALLVGSFLIFNTFSITVAQRVTEFGMLRTLGASRRQILSDGLVEALAIGAIGAVLGIGGGFLIAKLLNLLFKAFGVDLPTTGLVLETRTIVVSLLVGVVVTVVSSLIPALRSTRVPPIAALHAFAPKPSRPPASGLPRALDVAGGGRPGGGPDRPLRRRSSRDGRGPDGRRRGGDRLRRLAVQPAPGAAAGRYRGLAAGTAAPPARAALARERPAQPQPHRGHRCGADDRPVPSSPSSPSSPPA